MDLFDWEHARGSDPPTSHEAAASTDVSGQALRVLRAYRHGTAMLDHHAYWLAGFPEGRTSHQRCSDLRAAGFIERTGDRGMTPSGKAGYLCRITPRGLGYLVLKGGG